MTLSAGTIAVTKRLTVSTDSNRAGYPECAIAAGTTVTVVSGPAPYVNKLGTFYKVNTPDGMCIAVDAGNLKPAPKYVDTTWELRTYDVWGNAKDGYEVNDTYRAGEVTIRCKVEVNNAGTPQEFLSAYPSDSQIRRALSLRRFKLELDGDDLHIYVNRDGYPCGELYCTSHESLSPIRAKQTEVK